MQHRHLWIPHILTKPQSGHEEASTSVCQETDQKQMPSSWPYQSQRCREKLCCLKAFHRLRGSSQTHVYSHLHGPLGTPLRTLLAKPRPRQNGASGRAKPLHPPGCPSACRWCWQDPCSLLKGQAVDKMVDKQKANVKDRCCYGPKRS